MPTSLGPAEILVILVVALIVLGPKRLPEAGRQVGKAIAEVRKWSQGFQDEIRSAIDPTPGPPSYSEPQPGYTPPERPTEYNPGPVPMVPAETAPPADADASAPPASTNGSTVTTGSHGLVSGPAPADMTADSAVTVAPPSEPATDVTVAGPAPDEPATDAPPTDPAPTGPSGPAAGEPPRT